MSCVLFLPRIEQRQRKTRPRAMYAAPRSGLSCCIVGDNMSSARSAPRPRAVCAASRSCYAIRNADEEKVHVGKVHVDR
eukprot:4910106-Pyramimonas_sp.AAC.1